MDTGDLRSEIPRDAIVAVPLRFNIDHHGDIARGAYFRAERRGFTPGHEIEDWLAAEADLLARFTMVGRPP